MNVPQVPEELRLTSEAHRESFKLHSSSTFHQSFCLFLTLIAVVFLRFVFYTVLCLLVFSFNGWQSFLSLFSQGPITAHANYPGLFNAIYFKFGQNKKCKDIHELAIK